ncbi:MAG: response regulator [Caenispirillum bisanense]|nr:response regulator [Caenispirillum bisanense]MCA1974432.1 response regulator [Caenispirillum sp.]
MTTASSPVSAGPAAGSRLRPPVAHPECAILCVDDEKMILDALKVQISRALGDRYLYEFAENADEAMELIEDLHGDGVQVLVIVSDWLMPGLRGDEFLIAVHRRFPRIVKVLLTGQADAAAIERARTQGGLHRCLHKPWNEADLIDAIVSGLSEE